MPCTAFLSEHSEIVRCIIVPRHKYEVPSVIVRPTTTNQHWSQASKAHVYRLCYGP